eukprot:GEMP01026641.1.p1 GENE.GEMP01026641.1~~GEMP01026641.1.p1  ORF type:complete len:397 (-),score=92.38 GEMP01026641.1:1024-2214(-)
MTDVCARYLNGEDVIFRQCQDVMDLKLQVCQAHDDDRCAPEIRVLSREHAIPIDDTDDVPAPDFCSILILEPTEYCESRWSGAIRAHALEGGHSGLLRCRQLLDTLAPKRILWLFGSCLLYFSDRGNARAVGTILSTAAKESDSASAIVNYRDFLHYSPLMLAAREGHLTIVQRLLSARGDVRLCDKFKQSALFCAAELGRVDIVRVLLDARSTVNDVDATGQGLLSWAVEHAQNGAKEASSLHIIRLLVDAKAPVDIADLRDGTTPLSLAARDNHEAIVTFLLPHVDAASATNGWNGAEALIQAASRGHINIVRLLIQHAEGSIESNASSLAEDSVGNNGVDGNDFADRSCGTSRIRATVAQVYFAFSSAMHTAYYNGHFDIEGVLLGARAQIRM